MKHLIRKRQFLVVILCLLIVAGAYITHKDDPSVTTVMNPESSQTVTQKIYGEAQFVNGESPIYFSQARINRDRARGESLDLLREITENQDASQIDIETAVQAMARMADAGEQESKIENELQAKGLGETVVFITDAGATVTLASDSVGEEERTKILSSVIAETGLKADKIKIIEIK